MTGFDRQVNAKGGTLADVLVDRLGDISESLEALVARENRTLRLELPPAHPNVLEAFLDNHREIDPGLRSAIVTLCDAVVAERMLYVGETIGRLAVATLAEANKEAPSGA